MTHRGPFQLLTFCDSVNRLWASTKHQQSLQEPRALPARRAPCHYCLSTRQLFSRCHRETLTWTLSQTQPPSSSSASRSGWNSWAQPDAQIAGGREETRHRSRPGPSQPAPPARCRPGHSQTRAQRVAGRTSLGNNALTLRDQVGHLQRKSRSRLPQPATGKPRVNSSL